MSQSERIYFIHKSIHESGIVKLPDIVRRFEVSSRSAKRDIEYMRDRLEAPILYSPEKKGYFYSGPFELLDYLDERVLIFYALVQKIAGNRNYLPFVSKDILQRIEAYLSPEYRPIIGKISYELPETEDFDITVFQAMIDSVIKRKAAVFHYKDAEGRHSERNAEILHIINYSGRWYAIAYDTDKSELRTFLFSRVEGVKLTEKKQATAIRQDQIYRYIESSFGIFKGEQKAVAVIRFYDPVRHIVENETWHPKQTGKTGVDPKSGPYFELSLPVHDYREVLGKVLRYGPAAEVASPAEFRELWLKSIREMHEKYVVNE